MNYDEQDSPNLDNIQDPKVRETVEKIGVVVYKVDLIYKRIVLGIIILVLTLFIAFQTAIAVQTIKARNYVDTVATLVEIKKSEVLNDVIYTYKDKQGKDHEATTIASPDNEDVPEKIIVYYNPNNPDDYYEDASMMDSSELTWYIIEIIIDSLLIVLFFNSKLLSKINITVSNK